MPGRITNEAYDLLFVDPDNPNRPVGVMLVRDPKRATVLDEQYEPSELGQVSPPKPTPVIWDEHRGGAGVAKKVQGVSGAYKIARNAVTRFGRVVTPAGGLHELDLTVLGYAPGRISQFASFGSDVVCMTNDNKPLLIRNYGAGPVVQGATLTAGFHCEDATVFRNALYISGGGGDLVKFDGTNWTQPALGTLGRSRVATVNWTRQGSPRRRVVATNGAGSAFLYTTGDDPLNPAHWSAEVEIESAWPIQQLVGGPRHVYGIGPGGVFDLTETGETPNVLGETWTNNYDPSNGAAGLLYDGRLIVASSFGTFAVGLNGQLVDVLEDISIGHLQPAEIPVGGRARAFAVVDGWLAQVTYSSLTGTSQLWYGMRRERMGVSTPWPVIWHGSECDIDNLDVTAMHVVAPQGAPRRILFGCTNPSTGQTRLMWQSISRYGSPLQDYLFGSSGDRMDYARSWSVTETAEDLGDLGSTKDPLWWNVLGKYLGGPNRLTVSAAGRDGVLVEQGVATQDDMRIAATSIRDKAITVHVDGANSESVPAVYEAVKGSWVVTVDEDASLQLAVMFGEGVALLNGSEDTQDSALTFALLSSLNQKTNLSCVRWNGEELRVRLEQGIRRRWQESSKGDGWVEGAVLTLTLLSQPMRHDVGDRHDLGLRHDG